MGGQTACADGLDVEYGPADNPLRWLEKLTNGIDRCADAYGNQFGRRLRFSDMGKCRLATMVGYLYGLSKSDPVNAERIAKELYRQLEFLANYGGETSDLFEDMGLEEDSRPLPTYKVVIADDCWGIGGFSICWYRPISSRRMNEIRKELLPEGYSQMNDADRDAAWDAATAAMYGRCKIDKRDPYMLEETRFQPQAYEGQPYYCRTERFQYGFAFNGGLILHGASNMATASYSIHT